MAYFVVAQAVGAPRLVAWQPTPGVRHGGQQGRKARVVLVTGMALRGAIAAGDDNQQQTRKGKKGKKVPQTMTVEERLEWSKGLPLVQEQLPYTDVAELRQQEKVKHIIKHPGSILKERPDAVLVVLEDGRVVKTVLPASDRDTKFWTEWEKLKMDQLVMEAFSPAPAKPELVGWATKGPSLAFLSHISGWIRQLGKRNASTPSQKESAGKAAARARLEQIEEARKERERARLQREAESKRMKADLAKKERASKTKALSEQERAEKAALEAQEKVREQEELQQKLAQQVQRGDEWNDFWYHASRNEGFRFSMGVFFFWLFYQTIVVGVKKRKQDYEDRLKIEKAEDEERRKMKEWEEEMETIEAVSTSQDWGKEGMSEEDRKRLEEIESNPNLKAGLKFMRSGARVRHAKSRRRPQHLDLGADVKFSDVAGLGDIRKELEEIVDFFTFGEKYRRRGSRIPAGILLCGEPGTGKTLLAKAVAGEAGVNFFSISASQFVEIYVGVGASRVRALYNEARENAPAVVFIDELDAVGRQRGLIGGSGGQERDSTLNQLLTCLDGFEGRGDVITIAATNRPDILDKALVRPGRFDRKIFIPKPGTRGREEVLKVHARNKPMADEVDYTAVAEMTEGMVGAQLANILDVAALAVLRDRRSEITTDDLLEAAQLEEGGHPDPRPRTDTLLRKLALNEASMAAVAVNFLDFRNIQLVTIVPRMGEEKGAVRYRPDRSKFELQSVSRQDMFEYITVQLAPRAADELWNGPDQIGFKFGWIIQCSVVNSNHLLSKMYARAGAVEMSTIWADTVDQARKTAREMVFAGLSDRKDLYGLYDCWCEMDQVDAVDVEALKIVNSCYERALLILERNRNFVNKLIECLVEEKTIRKAQFQKLVDDYAVLDELSPHAIEIRDRNLAEFQEQMIQAKRSPQERKTLLK